MWCRLLAAGLLVTAGVREVTAGPAGLELRGLAIDDQARPQPIVRPVATAAALGAPAPTAAQPLSSTVYLNRDGAVVSPGTNDAKANTSSVPEFAGELAPFAGTEDDWQAIVACVRDLFAVYQVFIVDAEPAREVSYLEVVVGGDEAAIRTVTGGGVTLGLAPFRTSCEPIPDAMVFVFAEAILAEGLGTRGICEIAAQEIAHAYGLDHAMLASDIMTYLEFAGDRAFQDEDAACGEFAPEAYCGNQCSETQNSQAKLLETLGQRSEGSAQIRGGCSTGGGSNAGGVLALVAWMMFARRRRA